MTLRPLLFLLIALVLATSGCSKFSKLWKDENKNEGQPVEVIYDKAHGYMREERWASATETFQRLVAQYPYGAYTEQALMEMAYAEFKSGKHDDAISTIDRFIRTYPTHRNIAYFYYLRGLSNSTRNAIFLSKVFDLQMSNRDLSTPMQAYNDFSIVAERYPNSRYAADAGQRMIDLRNLFAKHELDTALYYLRRGANVAAIERAKYLLETYPQTRHQNDAVAVLGEAYTKLGNTALANDARRVLEQNDPKHPWLTGDWPDYPSNFRKLNPFAGEKSAAGHD
ncbi:outer membrane protein assembly factor BamD [Lysobacter helvus]|uniref:Outer membrane protein assembly factor BamD n=3 Tax=Lysobacterales TaxID=135614 RepID=A0ABN6FQ59_9GAMM|nr:MULTISPECIES: outer membrane protein assembly factor BamD [Lysobacter]BCT91733.1 outer membrane protein assembly factor BamD [Lysobacter caseinilyticus]BCT94886.1 outer membrane protein assembly factor BamD [Lysobacter helvus]